MEMIARYRAAANMQQAELAARLGINQCSVSKMEQPGNYPSAEKLPAIADALGVTIDALFGRETPPAE